MKKILALTICILLALAVPGWAAYGPDAFTGANGTALATYDANWTTPVGGWNIQSNTANATGAGADNVAPYTGGTFANDQYSLATLVTAATYQGVGVRFAADGSVGYVGILLASNTVGRITKIGTGTLGADITLTDTFVPGTSKMKVTVTGSTTTTVKMYIDFAANGTWVEQASRDDSSSPITSGYAGIYCYSSDGRVDNWEGGNLANPPTIWTGQYKATATHDYVVQSIGGTTALAWGCIEGTSANDAVTENGIVVGASANPTTANSKFTATLRADSKHWGWNGKGNYSAELTGLSPSTTYHYRAYIISGGTTYYGTDQTFDTLTTPTGSTYYVDKDSIGGTASDAYTTTQAKTITTPWATLEHAIPLLQPGDTLYLRTGYYGLVSGNRIGMGTEIDINSGTKEKPIVISGYQSEAVTITGLVNITGLTWTKVSGSIYTASYTGPGENGFWQLSQDYVPLLAKPSQNGTGTNTDLTGAGQYAITGIGGNDYNIWVWCTDGASPSTHTMQIMYRQNVVDFEFFGYGTNYIQFKNMAIEGGYWPVAIATSHITFDGVTFRNYDGFVKGLGETATSWFNSEYCTLNNCTFYNLRDVPLDITGGDYWTVSNCTFTGPGPSVTYGCIVMLKNNNIGTAFKSNYLSGWASASYGPVIACGGQSFGGKEYECVDAIVSNNIINNCTMGQAVSFQAAYNCKAINNTVYNCAFTGAMFGQGASTGTNYSSSNSLKNNLIWSCTSATGHFYNDDGNNPLNSWASDYNIIYDSPAIDYYILGVSRSFAYVQGTLSPAQEVNSLISTNGTTYNPLFANGSGLYNTATDFKIKTGSPAIGAGVNVGLTTDFDGTAYTTNYPIGAWDLTASAPTVTTQAVSAVSFTTATGNGTITVNDGTISENGVAIGASANPTIAGTHFNPSPADVSGAFTAALTGLTPNTLYHARAFATNEAGTGYGADVEFTTSQVLGGGTSLGLGLGGGNYRPRP